MLTTIPTDPIVRCSIRVNGRRISYLTIERSSARDTIVLIHGSGVSARAWTEQLRGLPPALRVVALDLPGHGESDPVGASSVEAYADVVGEFLDALDLGPVFLAGHSLGGAVALALAARRSHTVEGLVLLASCARLSQGSRWAEKLLAHLPGPLRNVAFFVMAEKVLFAPGASHLAVRLGMQELLACRPRTILGDLQAAKAMDLTDQARRLDLPTLIVCGTRDQVTPAPLSERLNELIRRSRIILVEGAGHMLLLEAAHRVNRHILDFVDGVAGERRAAASRSLPTAPVLSLLKRLVERVHALFRG